MSFSWAHGAPPVWDPLSTIRWDQTGRSDVAPRVNHSSMPPLGTPQRFPPFAPAMFTQLPAQFPPRERSPQLLVSSYPAAYPQSSGNFSTQAHGMPAIRHSVTGPPELNPAAWAADRFGTVKNYRCGYCKIIKESSSGVRNKRARIRCECGGPHQDGQNRMHSR